MLDAPARVEVQRPAPTSDELRRAVVAHYRRLGARLGLYVRLRFALAPLLETLSYVPPHGDVLDLGCGYGIFAHLVRLSFPGRRIVGVDADAGRIAVAARTIDGPELRFVHGRIEDSPLNGTPVVLLIDVLHHLPSAVHEPIIRRIADALPGGGWLLVKDLQTEPAWKYWWHYAQDALSYRSRLYFRSRGDMAALLGAGGLRVRVVDLAVGRSQPHVLYVCQKTVA